MNLDDHRYHQRCGDDCTPYCPWFCHVCEKHHPVPGMVTDHEERATRPS